MSRIPIPDDWIEATNGWTMFMLCCPDSVQWRALVRGSVYNLTRGRKWDERTGTITEAQEVAERIYDSMQNCGDLLKVQRMLVAAIIGQAVDLTDPAQLTPDNVDFTLNGLVPTVAALDLSVTNEVNPATVNITNDVNPPTVILDCGCTGACGCGGSEIESEPGIEGDPPPFGWEEPKDIQGGIIYPGSEDYQLRKCKMSNAIHSAFRDGVGAVDGIEFWGAGVETLATLLGATWLSVISALLSSIVAVAEGVIATVGLAVSGYLDELAQSLVENGADLTTLHQALIDNEENLVCALYNAPDATQAVDDYLAILDAAPVGAANMLIAYAWFTIEYTNLTMFQKNETIERLLDGYVGPIDCANCGCGNQIQFNYGQIISDELGTIQASSTFADNFHRVAIVFNSFGGVYCGPTVEISNSSIIAGTATPPGAPKLYRCFSDTGSGQTGDVYDSDTIPGTVAGVRRYVITSTTAFTIEVDYT